MADAQEPRVAWTNDSGLMTLVSGGVSANQGLQAAGTEKGLVTNNGTKIHAGPSAVRVSLRSPRRVPHTMTPTLADEREQVYEREHRIAESLQRVLLRVAPGETLPGVCVEGFHETVMDEATAGGDSFDAFLLDDDRVAIVVADASGKGL